MFSKELWTLVLAAFVVTLGVSGAGADLITNGTFETLVPSNATGGGWTSSVIDGAGGWRDTDGNPDEMFILNHGGLSLSDPTIEQTVSGLISGATYTVTGDYAWAHECCGNSSPMSFGVFIDDVLQYEDGHGAFLVWEPFSFDFVAGDSSVVLKLAGERNGDDSSYNIDNITMELTLIPAFSSTALAAIGFTTIIARRRRSAG